MLVFDDSKPLGGGGAGLLGVAEVPLRDLMIGEISYLNRAIA